MKTHPALPSMKAPPDQKTLLIFVFLSSRYIYSGIDLTAQTIVTHNKIANTFECLVTYL